MNKISLDYLRHSTGEEIISVCQPLFKHSDINYFAYMRYYKTGEIVEICTNSQFAYNMHAENCALDPAELQRIINCYNSNDYLSAFYGNVIPLPPALKNKEMHKRNIIMSEEMGIKNRFYIFKDFGSYIELVGFASSKNNSMINDYMNAQDILEKFAFYFKNHTYLLIEKLKKLSKEQGFLSSFVDWNSYSETIHNNVSPINHNLILEKLELNKVYFDNNIKLTKQEIKSIIYFAHGYSAKIIARKLNIAPKTVETHIFKSKLKLNYISKENLINILNNYGISKSVLPLLKSNKEYPANNKKICESGKKFNLLKK